MIEKFDFAYSDAVNALGRSLSSSYEVKKRGELEEILVYLKGDEVIGFIQYIKLYETIEILYLVVKGDYRRLGIGSEFLDFLSRDLEVERFILEVRKSNEVAKAFYLKNGFKRLRPIKNYYRDGEDALSLEKVIR